MKTLLAPVVGLVGTLLLLTGCSHLDDLATERFARMPAADDVVADGSWYTPTVTVQGRDHPWFSAELEQQARAETQPAPLAAARQLARDYDTLALIVIRDGRVLLEDYAAGIDPARRFDTQSMHRGLLVLAVLAAIEDRHIPSLDTPAARWLPEWRGADDPRRLITVGDLLWGQAGLADPPFENRPDSPGMQMFIGPDLRRITLAQPARAARGTVDRSSTLDAQVLGLVLEAATGQSYAAYLSRRIWQPAGAADAYVRLDRPRGNTRTFCCIQASARDWARIGQLVLDRGVGAHGRALQEQSIARMLAPSPLSAAHGMVWSGEPVLLVPRSVQAGRAAPVLTPFAEDGVFYIGGRGGQRVFVLTRQRAVIVRIGRVRNDVDDGKFVNAFIAALQP
jgi:CubicO group peptidase (beta-lactamase class C family)